METGNLSSFTRVRLSQNLLCGPSTRIHGLRHNRFKSRRTSGSDVNVKILHRCTAAELHQQFSCIWFENFLCCLFGWLLFNIDCCCRRSKQVFIRSIQLVLCNRRFEWPRDSHLLLRLFRKMGCFIWSEALCVFAVSWLQLIHVLALSLSCRWAACAVGGFQWWGITAASSTWLQCGRIRGCWRCHDLAYWIMCVAGKFWAGLKAETISQLLANRSIRNILRSLSPAYFWRINKTMSLELHHLHQPTATHLIPPSRHHTVQIPSIFELYRTLRLSLWTSSLQRSINIWNGTHGSSKRILIGSIRIPIWIGSAFRFVLRDLTRWLLFDCDGISLVCFLRRSLDFKSLGFGILRLLWVVLGGSVAWVFLDQGWWWFQKPCRGRVRRLLSLKVLWSRNLHFRRLWSWLLRMFRCVFKLFVCKYLLCFIVWYATHVPWFGIITWKSCRLLRFTIGRSITKLITNSLRRLRWIIPLRRIRCILSNRSFGMANPFALFTQSMMIDLHKFLLHDVLNSLRFLNLISLLHRMSMLIIWKRPRQGTYKTGTGLLID